MGSKSDLWPVKISACTMCRNAQKLYYPIKESIESALPFVDEFVVAVGKGDPDDNTLDLVKRISSPKLKIVETEWDLEAFPNGMANAQQTDLAMSHCTGDWILYLQADEVLHEKDWPLIQVYADAYLEDSEVEGFLFQYLHFWGDYEHIVTAHGWYQKEIRVVRNRPDIHSWESAQSFRVIPDFDGRSYRKKEGSRKLKVVEIPARIYHYGWVRPPQLMTEKMNALDKIHSHPSKRYTAPFDYGRAKDYTRFNGTHPAVMEEWMERMNWNPWSKAQQSSWKPKHLRRRYRIMTWLERNLLGGRQVLVNRNYKKVG